MQLPLGFALCALVLGLSLSAPGHAFRIDPEGTPFSGTGPISFSKGVIGASCTISIDGRVSADGSEALIESVSFGGRSFQCRRVTATHLPWKYFPTSEASGDISGIQVNVRAPLVGGDCGPTTAPSSWNPQQGTLHVANVELQGGCAIDEMTIQLTPMLRAVPTGAP